jgi:hypothetical protein
MTNARRIFLNSIELLNSAYLLLSEFRVLRIQCQTAAKVTVDCCQSRCVECLNLMNLIKNIRRLAVFRILR